MATKNIVPNDNGEGGIGVTAKRWNTGFINTLTGNVTGNLTGQVLTAAQTNINSILATDLIIGEDAETAIDFGTANEIDFKVDNANRLTLTSSVLAPATTNQIDLGTSSLEFKDAFFDGTVTADAFAGPLTGNVTGNVSGTAATVTGAAQSNITSLGTLTGLTLSGNITTTAAGATVTIQDNADSTSGGTLALQNTDTGADNHESGRIYFYGDNDGNTVKESVLIRGIMTDASAGTEDTKLELMTLVNSGQVSSLTVEGNGIFVPNDGTIGSAGTTDAIKIASDGDTSLGTTQVLSKLNVKNDGNGSITRGLGLYNNAHSGSGTGISLDFYVNAGDNDRCARIISQQESTGNFANLEFHTSNNGTVTKRLTIGADGNATFAGDIAVSGGDITLGNAANASINPLAASSGAGKALTIAGGNAQSGGTNLNAGGLFLLSGNSTGSGTGVIEFYTAPAGSSGTGSNSTVNRLTVESNGNVTVEDGDLVIGTAGHGITFSATNSPAQNAGSGSSNTLDNYEEGTWSPVITFASGTQTFHSGSVLGQYTLVGRKVTAFCEFAISDLDGANTNTLRIDGMPFNVTSSTGSCGYGTIPINGHTVNFSRTSDTRFSGNLYNGNFAGLAHGSDASQSRTVVCLMYHI